MKRIQREPVLIYSVVQSAIAVLTAFGLNLTADQVAAVLVFTGSLLAVVCRNFTTPTRRQEP